MFLIQFVCWLPVPLLRSCILFNAWAVTSGVCKAGGAHRALVNNNTQLILYTDLRALRQNTAPRAQKGDRQVCIIPEIPPHVCFSKPCKTWIFNKGFNLSFQLLAAVSFDVFALLPSVVFSYLFHHFSIAQIPPGCVWMCLAVGREGKRRKPFLCPLRLLLWFSKVVGRQFLCACRRVSDLCRVFSGSTAQLSGFLVWWGEGWARAVLACLTRWNVQLWSMGEAELQVGNIFLLGF